MFVQHQIRDCSVRLERILVEKGIGKTSPKKKRLLLDNSATSNLKVSWMQSKSSAPQNSQALSLLAAYQAKHDIAQPRTKKNVRRERAKSMLIDRPRPTIDDMNEEFHVKFATPNHGLRPVSSIMAQTKDQAITEWKKIHHEIHQKLQAKQSK